MKTKFAVLVCAPLLLGGCGKPTDDATPTDTTKERLRDFSEQRSFIEEDFTFVARNAREAREVFKLLYSIELPADAEFESLNYHHSHDTDQWDRGQFVMSSQSAADLLDSLESHLRTVEGGRFWYRDSVDRPSRNSLIARGRGNDEWDCEFHYDQESSRFSYNYSYADL